MRSKAGKFREHRLISAKFPSNPRPLLLGSELFHQSGSVCSVLLMTTTEEQPAVSRFSGMTIDLAGLGRTRLTYVLKQTSETVIFRTTHEGVVVKIFDLTDPKPGELAYGPYTRFGLELANFDDIIKIDALRPFLPAYYGASVNREKQFAYIAMEFFPGEDLQTWCDNAANDGFPAEWVMEFRQAIYEALSIMTLFHRHRIIVLDFKPDNILRVGERGVKFVDLGAFFTPRHHQATEKYVYSATPDYAELLIDVSNIDTGLPPTSASDLFSAGVALYEMATESSRLYIDDHTADEILARPEVYKFRDSQIRDLWRQYPHLQAVLPMVETQLRERRLLFSEIWHVLKAYVASKVPEWESLSSEQRDQIILATGTTFVQEQLPEQLQWLAGPIAQSTALRGARLKSVEALMALIQNPVEPEVRESIEQSNALVQYLRDMEHSVDFVNRLNTWDARLNRASGRYGIAASVAYAQLLDSALFTFIKLADRDPYGHRFYEIVSDLEADDFQDGKLTLANIHDDHLAWIGAGSGYAMARP
jgi:serine/threonine protein kinase